MTPELLLCFVDAVKAIAPVNLEDNGAPDDPRFRFQVDGEWAESYFKNEAWLFRIFVGPFDSDPKRLDKIHKAISSANDKIPKTIRAQFIEQDGYLCTRAMIDLKWLENNAEFRRVAMDRGIDSARKLRVHDLAARLLGKFPRAV